MKQLKSIVLVEMAIVAILATVAIPGLVAYFCLGLDLAWSCGASLAWAVILVAAAYTATSPGDEDD